MSYIDELAAEIRRQIPANLLPDGDTTGLFRIYAVLAMAKGDQVGLEDVHDAWSAWMSDRNPDHESLLPLHELPKDVQGADKPYLDAITAIARTHNIGR